MLFFDTDYLIEFYPMICNKGHFISVGPYKTFDLCWPTLKVKI